MEPFALAALALIPGGAYTWSFERWTGSWGAGFADRASRLIGASAVFFVVLGIPTWNLLVAADVPQNLATDQSLPLWLAGVGATWLLLPTVAGWWVAQGYRRQRPWTKWLLGPAPAPRAWDYLFSTGHSEGWIRLRLLDGTWIVGAFARGLHGGGTGYASGFPHDCDLWLPETYWVDDTGQAMTDQSGALMPRGFGVLIRWSEVRYLDFALVSRTVEDERGEGG